MNLKRWMCSSHFMVPPLKTHINFLSVRVLLSMNSYYWFPRRVSILSGSTLHWCPLQLCHIRRVGSGAPGFLNGMLALLYSHSLVCTFTNIMFIVLCGCALLVMSYFEELKYVPCKKWQRVYFRIFWNFELIFVFWSSANSLDLICSSW